MNSEIIADDQASAADGVMAAHLYQPCHVQNACVCNTRIHVE